MAISCLFPRIYMLHICGWEVNISTDTLYSGYSEAGKVVMARLEDAMVAAPGWGPGPGRP